MICRAVSKSISMICVRGQTAQMRACLLCWDKGCMPKRSRQFARTSGGATFTCLSLAWPYLTVASSASQQPASQPLFTGNGCTQARTRLFFFFCQTRSFGFLRVGLGPNLPLSSRAKKQKTKKNHYTMSAFLYVLLAVRVSVSGSGASRQI